MTGAPIRVTLADATPTGVPAHVADAMAVTALHLAAEDLRSRRCTDCGAPYLVVEDEDHGAFTATPTCPPPCRGHVPPRKTHRRSKWH